MPFYKLQEDIKIQKLIRIRKNQMNCYRKKKTLIINTKSTKTEEKGKKEEGKDMNEKDRGNVNVVMTMIILKKQNEEKFTDQQNIVEIEINHMKENYLDIKQNIVKEKKEDIFIITDNKEMQLDVKTIYRKKCYKNIQQEINSR